MRDYDSELIREVALQEVRGLRATLQFVLQSLAGWGTMSDHQLRQTVSAIWLDLDPPQDLLRRAQLRSLSFGTQCKCMCGSTSCSSVSRKTLGSQDTPTRKTILT